MLVSDNQEPRSDFNGHMDLVTGGAARESIPASGHDGKPPFHMSNCLEQTSPIAHCYHPISG
jgi:hypothetical protein